LDADLVTADQHVAVHRKRAIVVAATFGALVYLIFFALIMSLTVWWAPLWVAPVVSLLVAAIWIGIAWFNAASAVLDLSEVEPAEGPQAARLINAATGLSGAAGISMPDMYVVDDPAINAMATGRDSRNASVVVTSGLLNELDLVELEAVLALVFHRIKTGQIGPETLAVATYGAVAVLGESVDQWMAVQRILLSPMPLIEKVLVALHPADDEPIADIASTLITRYPPALASALEKMEGRSALAMGTRVTAHLWVAPPVNVATKTATAGVHKPLRDRVAVLREL
jgi:heat shock protein HtpX